VPDLGKLTRVVRAAVRDRTALPARRKQLWVTEISWDSNPPDPYGVPEARHARWLEQAIETLWKQGVDVMTWFQVRDQAEGEGWQFGNQSGVFLRDGRPKRAATAFHFPFVAKRVGRGVRYWLRAPATGTITIQTKVGGRWHASARRRVRRGGVLASTLSHVDGTHLRAALGSELSLNWRL